MELLEARLERDLDRGATGLGPHLDDVSIAAGSRDLRSFGSQGEQRTAVLALLLAEAALIEERRGEAPLLLLDDVLSELDPGRRRVLMEQLSAPRPDADHLDDGGRAARGAGAAPACDTRRGGVERITSAVKQELSRFGAQGGMPELVEAWPEAVGPMVAANAWPARIARDGTLHVNTSSSAWAFELGQLAPEISTKLSERLGERAPKALRFAVGHLPEPPSPTSEDARTPVPEPTPEALQQGGRAGGRDRGRRAAKKGRKSGFSGPFGRP